MHMLLDDKIFKSEILSKKISFITEQSSERRDEEIRYKNINRKFITFDLSDTQTMLVLGKILHPYGLNENLGSKLLKSKILIVRIWAEKKMIKYARTFLRLLYLKHPEKFSEIEYETIKKKSMKLVKANYILSELTSQKSISLKDTQHNQFGDFKEHQRMFQDNITSNAPHNQQYEQTLLEMY